MRAKQSASTVRALGTEAGVDEPPFVGQQNYLGHGIVICKSVTPCPMLQMLVNQV